MGGFDLFWGGNLSWAYNRVFPQKKKKKKKNHQFGPSGSEFLGSKVSEGAFARFLGEGFWHRFASTFSEGRFFLPHRKLPICFSRKILFPKGPLLEAVFGRFSWGFAWNSIGKISGSGPGGGFSSFFACLFSKGRVKGIVVT